MSLDYRRSAKFARPIKVKMNTSIQTISSDATVPMSTHCARTTNQETTSHISVQLGLIINRVSKNTRSDVASAEYNMVFSNYRLARGTVSCKEFPHSDDVALEVTATKCDV